MKGQIFTLDVLASVLVATIILAVFASQADQAYSRSNDARFAYAQTLADDLAQMAVKNVLSPTKWPNYVLKNLQQFNNLADIVTQPYDCEASLAGDSTQCFTGCAGKSIVAVSRRPVFIQNPPSTGEFIVKVCV